MVSEPIELGEPPDQELEDSELLESSEKEWTYEPATDLDATFGERLRRFPREPHLWMYLLRSVAALMMRGWFRLYHRFGVEGAESLPLGQSFVMVANHQSHLDAPCLLAAIPLRWLHRAFPAAAADYFFSNLPRSAVTSVLINALPFDRETKGAESLAVCRELLKNEGNILILFPEGTRGSEDAVGRFRSGIGRLVLGTDILVVPCFLDGAARAFPKGAAVPRPRRVSLRIGAPRTYGDREPTREMALAIASDLEVAVTALGRGAE